MGTQENYIPKLIHYCWFGRRRKSKLIIKYIGTWKKVLPDYQIIEWNEDNFDIYYNDYVREAYENKKFAFVSDVARLCALYNYGGIYLDTDIEVIQSLDKYLNVADILAAFESKKLIMTGFMAAKKENSIIKDFLDYYDNMKFCNEDGTLNCTANTVIYTKLLQEKGLKINKKEMQTFKQIVVFPIEVFGAYDADNSKFVINDSTVLIHHCDASWMKRNVRFRIKIQRLLACIVGPKIYEKLKKIIK